MTAAGNFDPLVKTLCPTGEQPTLLRENEFLRQRIDKEARLQYKEVCFVRLQRSGRYSASSTAWKRAS